MTTSSPTSVFSTLLFSWIRPLIRKSDSEHLTESSTPPLPEQHSVEREFPRLNEAIERYRTGLATPLVRPLVATYRLSILATVALATLALCLATATPLLLRQLLVALDSGSAAPVWFSSMIHPWFGVQPHYAYPLACALALGAVSTLHVFAIHHLFFVQPILGLRIRSALNHLIFNKALRQERASHLNVSTGFIINLVGTDSQKVTTFVQFMHSIYYHPLSLLVVLIILYTWVGVPALVGSATLLVLLGASIVIARHQGRIRKQTAALADSRVGLTRETLLHIKAAKLQGWESTLGAKIQAYRTQESVLGRRLAQLTALLSFISGTAPAIAMATTAVLIYYSGEKLDAALVFPMLSLFMMLRFSIANLPEMLYNLVETGVSLRRIRSFLDTPEFTSPTIHPELPYALSWEGLSVTWPNGKPACIVPRLHIGRGELVVIVGSVGSGKSALLLSILGELKPSTGTITIGGSLGYVPQNPWIVSDSIRNNILCGKPFDSDRYRRAIRASGMAVDLSNLPNGDNTQIGERGINLSGGQRHRVALARAYYLGADIFLFDDPLSALDPHVANHVFTQLICRELSGCTRIVVTHRVEFALAADRILVVENGAILEQGAPADLQKQGSRFAELVEFHAKTNKENAQAIAASTPPGTTSDSLPEEFDESDEKNTIIVAEERRRGAVTRSTAVEYLSRMASPAVLMIILALFIGRQLTATMTDVWLARSAQAESLNPTVFIGVYLCCIAVLCLLGYWRALYMLTSGFVAGVRSHERLLRGVLHAPMRFFESNPVGRILNRFSRDLETVENFLPRNLFDATHCLCDTLAVCIVIAIIAPVTLVVIVPIAILYYRLYLRYRPAARELQRLASVSLSPVFAIFSESLAGLETLRVTGLNRLFTERFRAALDTQTRVVRAQTATNRWLGVRLEMLGTSVLLCVAVVMSFGLDMAVGVAFSGLALSYANAMMGSMNWAIRSLSMAESSLTSFERMERYAKTESERVEGAMPPPGWPTAGGVTLSNLSVRYRPELPLVLRSISCSIPPGSRVGIVGRTGSGKSTLLLAFMRLLEPYDGSIEIDGINLTALSLAGLRQSIAVVPQEPVLFSGTLRESLDPFNQFSDTAIEAALTHVELVEFVRTLPEGLDTKVHEGGFNFSCGQRQLICLARALLRKSKVIILDEATASIDVETDHAIQRAIREEFKDSTILVIAHRLGTVLDSDLILSLRNGELVEFGSPQELLKEPHSILGGFLRDIQSALETDRSANEG